MTDDRAHPRPHPDDVLADFDDLPLPVKMRAAAKVLVEAEKRNGWGKDADWCTDWILREADKFEAADTAAEAEVEQLAKDMFDLTVHPFGWSEDESGARDLYRNWARSLRESGWRRTPVEGGA